LICNRNVDTAESMEKPKTNILEGLPVWLTITVCIFFLIFSVGVWMTWNATLGRILYYILFFVPNLLCGQYLGEKIFSRAHGLSISKAGFSPLRIFVGVCFVLGFFVLVYGIATFLRLSIH